MLAILAYTEARSKYRVHLRGLASEQHTQHSSKEALLRWQAGRCAGFDRRENRTQI